MPRMGPRALACTRPKIRSGPMTPAAVGVLSFVGIYLYLPEHTYVCMYVRLRGVRRSGSGTWNSNDGQGIVMWEEIWRRAT